MTDEQLADLMEKIEDLAQTVQRNTAAISRLSGTITTTGSPVQLLQVAGTPFGDCVLEMRIWKQRIYRRYIAYKFEANKIERLGRIARQRELVVTTEQLLTDRAAAGHNDFNQAKVNINRRRTTLMSWVKRFNTLQEQCIRMDAAGERPANARLPQPININLFWSLEMDAEVFADAAFDWEEGVEVPAWLGDAAMKQGIRGELGLRRCEEETARLDRECQTLERWLLDREAVLGEARQRAAGLCSQPYREIPSLTMLQILETLRCRINLTSCWLNTI